MHKITEQYQADIKKYEDFKLKIEVLVKELIIQKGINFHKIESRIKDISKLEEKIKRKNEKYNSISDITDAVGVRVITYFEDDVDKVATIIDEEFAKDKINSIDKRNLESDRFGYKSLHYVVNLNPHRKNLTEYSRFKDMKFEIQIRSVLQHAWAEIEHDLGYKGENSIPNAVKRNFYRVAALLETADIEFVKIKDQLKLYEENVGDKIKENPREVEINSASLKSYISSNLLISEIDKEIARATHTHLYNSEIYDAGRYIEKLYFLNIKTIEQLENKLKQNKNSVIDFARIWNKDSVLEGSFHNGISIFYLCYVLVGEKNDIEFATTYFEQYIGVNEDYDEPNTNKAKDIVRIYNEMTNLKSAS